MADDGELEFADVYHDCEPPNLTDVAPAYGRRDQVFAKWRCLECQARWEYRAVFLDHDRLLWKRVSGPSRRWKRQEIVRMREVLHRKSIGRAIYKGMGRAK